MNQVDDGVESRAEREKVFGELLAEQRDMVFNLLFRLTGDYHTSEDLFQESFLRAYRGLEGYDGRSKLGTWIYAIAVNVFRDYLRRKRRAAPLLHRFHEGGELEAPDPAPEKSFILDEERKDIQVALNDLKEHLKVPVVLFYIEGMSVREIADVTGRTLSDIKVSLYRARKILKKRLEATR